MASASGDGNRIQQFKEIEVQFFKQALRGALFGLQLGPSVVCQLCRAEHIIYAAVDVKNLVDLLSMTFVCQLQLVLQVVETVVDWSGTQHQDFCLDSCSDYLVHQSLIAVFLLLTIIQYIQVVSLIILVIHITAIAEIVAFVYDYQVVVTPVDSFKINSV